MEDASGEREQERWLEKKGHHESSEMESGSVGEIAAGVIIIIIIRVFISPQDKTTYLMSQKLYKLCLKILLSFTVNGA